MKPIRLITAALIAFAIGTGFAAANSNRVNPPPIVLSPNVADPWITQLQPGFKMRRPQTERRSIFSRQPRRRQATSSTRAIRATRGTATGSHRGAVQTASVAAPERQIAAQFLPTVVDYPGTHAPGTIVIDTSSRYLYLVERDGRARRYGVGVGRQGFSWSGTERITRKAEWPDWRPPASMIAREKRKGRHLPSFMPGGPNNPMGARALYLGSTLYRIHGSNQPWTIGHAVSSGCIRMRNEDVTDLYNRVGVGTKVVVL
ncbi:MAG: L,D-transpeptidase [Pseudomonadota bacterium]